MHNPLPIWDTSYFWKGKVFRQDIHIENIAIDQVIYWEMIIWITINCGKFWKTWEYQTTWPATWETFLQVRKQQLELDMEQQTGSK